jgi:hypothetical protein
MSTGHGRPKLQAGFMDDVSDYDTAKKFIEENVGSFNYKAISGALSMVIWGLIMAKAKSGYNAASSKDHATVSSSWKNTLVLLVLTAIATVTQVKFDTQGISLAQGTAVESPKSNGRNLAATYETTEEDSDQMSFSELVL